MNLQEQIYQAVETIAENIINKTSYLYQVQGVIKKVDPLGNYYKFDYQGTEFTGYSVSGEKYHENDLVYVLFTNSDPMAKKMIISKVEAYNNTIDMSDVVDNMPRIELTGQNIFIQAPNGTMTPLNTTITANCYNEIYVVDWFIDDVLVTTGVSEDKQSINISAELLKDKNNIVVKALGNVNGLFDTISVVKLIDGEVGQSATFVNTDKSSLAIPTDANGNFGDFSNASVQYAVLEGLDDVTSSWGAPTITPTLGVSVVHSFENRQVEVTGLSADAGQIEIKFTKDGASLIKRIEVFKVKWGQDGIIGGDGAPAYTVSLSDEATLWATDSLSTPLMDAMAEVKATVYKGIDRLVLGSGDRGTNTFKIKSVTPGSHSGVTVAISSNSGAVTFSVKKGVGITTDRSEYIVVILADGIEFEKTFTWALSKSGQGGADGVGISQITEYYLATDASSGVTSSTSGWTTTVQSMTPVKKYLWNYEVTKFTDNKTTSGTPRIIGVYGDAGSNGSDGAPGNGISSIVNYYLATTVQTGVTISTSGWTTAVQTTTSVNKYLWNYEKITYTNGQIVNTSPCVIGTYGDKGEAGLDGQDAEIVSIMMNANIIVRQYDEKDEGVFSHYPNTVLATPNFSNVTYTKWQRMVGSTWTDITNDATLGLSINATTKELSIVSEKAVSLMPMRIRILATGKDGEIVSDETTIQYIEEQKSNYTFALSNPMVQISGIDMSRASTEIDLYYGTTKQSGWTFNVVNPPKVQSIISGNVLYLRDIEMTEGEVEIFDKVEVTATKAGRTTQKIIIPVARLRAGVLIHVGQTAPPYPNIGDLWWNTSKAPAILVVFDGSDWLESSEASESFKDIQSSLNSHKIIMGATVETILAGKGNLILSSDNISKYWSTGPGKLIQAEPGVNSGIINLEYSSESMELSDLKTVFTSVAKNDSLKAAAFTAGVPYTLSFEIRGDYSDTAKVSIKPYKPPVESGQPEETIPDLVEITTILAVKNESTQEITYPWQKREATFYTTESGYVASEIVIEGVSIDSPADVPVIQIQELKLEVGERATSWSPATIDYKSELEMTKDGLKLTAQKTSETEAKLAELEFNHSELSLKFENQVVGGANLLKNSDFRVYQDYSLPVPEEGVDEDEWELPPPIGWDEELNGTILPDNWILYQKDVPNPQSGRHAHMVKDGASWAVKFANDGVGSDIQYLQTQEVKGSLTAKTDNSRLKLARQILTDVQKARILPGENLVFSADIMAQDGAPTMRWGLDYRTTEEDESSPISVTETYHPNPAEGWKRYFGTIKVESSIDLGSEVSLFIQGNSEEYGTFLVKNVQLQRGTSATDWNQSPLDYDGDLSDLENKISQIKLSSDGLKMQFTKDYDNRAAIMEVGSDDSNNPYIILGRRDKSELPTGVVEPEVRIDNSGMKISIGELTPEEDNVVASFTTEGMYVQKGTIVESLQIGDIGFYSESDGSVSLKLAAKK